MHYLHANFPTLVIPKPEQFEFGDIPEPKVHSTLTFLARRHIEIIDACNTELVVIHHACWLHSVTKTFCPLDGYSSTNGIKIAVWQTCNRHQLWLDATTKNGVHWKQRGNRRGLLTTPNVVEVIQHLMAQKCSSCEITNTTEYQARTWKQWVRLSMLPFIQRSSQMQVYSWTYCMLVRTTSLRAYNGLQVR